MNFQNKNIISWKQRRCLYKIRMFFETLQNYLTFALHQAMFLHFHGHRLIHIFPPKTSVLITYTSACTYVHCTPRGDWIIYRRPGSFRPSCLFTIFFLGVYPESIEWFIRARLSRGRIIIRLPPLPSACCLSFSLCRRSSLLTGEGGRGAGGGARSQIIRPRETQWPAKKLTILSVYTPSKTL